MVIENMREWVFQRVKPEIANWISTARACLSPQILSFEGEHIEQRRRAVSLEPPQERVPIMFSGSRRRYSLSKATQTLSRGKTTPERAAGRPSVSLVCQKKAVHVSNERSDVEEDNDSEGSEAGENEDQTNYEDPEDIEAEYSASDTESFKKIEARQLRSPRLRCNNKNASSTTSACGSNNTNTSGGLFGGCSSKKNQQKPVGGLLRSLSDCSPKSRRDSGFDFKQLGRNYRLNPYQGTERYRE
jgi:hypothetical protein